MVTEPGAQMAESERVRIAVGRGNMVMVLLVVSLQPSAVVTI
jgi:hypothetical protein